MAACASSAGRATSTPSGNKTKMVNQLFYFWFDTLSGNRTRVKGVEDPHSTTELSALSHVEVLGIEPRLTGSKPAVLTTALYL